MYRALTVGLLLLCSHANSHASAHASIHASTHASTHVSTRASTHVSPHVSSDTSTHAPAPAITPRIYHGSDARPGDWPWITYVALGSPDFVTQFCGGVLIAPQLLLSAAHCVFVGTTRITELHASLEPMSRPISAADFDATAVEQSGELRILPHPDYQPGAELYEHDIMLVKLDTALHPARFPVLGAPADIASLERLPAAARRGAVQVAGWGTTDASGQLPQRLQQVALDYIPHAQCHSQWRSYTSRLAITDMMLCAAGAGPSLPAPDTCTGDSGGPLVRGTPDTGRLLGLTSFGQDCGVINPPGVYTDVTGHIGWLEQAATTLGQPLVDIATSLPDRVRAGIGATTTVRWQVRNDSLRTTADGIALSLAVPTGLNIDNFQGAGCQQSGATINCQLSQPLGHGSAHTISMDIAHLGDTELSTPLTVRVTQQQHDYRGDNNAGTIMLTFTDRPAPSRSSGGASYWLPTLAALALLRRRRAAFSHISR